ncbi:MAG: calcium/proton exchanger [Elainella sp. Prado103]|nr:calcium/proton exchanger [Elainella sp. Prado103]
MNSNLFSLGLLIFVPVAITADWLDWDDTIVFGTSALAIIPLSIGLTTATEKIATVMGPLIGGLVNAVFGSATVLIIMLMALRQGLIDIVEASITGSILNALLLMLGLAMLTGGLRYKEQQFQPILAKVNGASMTLAVIAIALPTLAFATSELANSEIRTISWIVSTVLIVVYGLTLLFSLKTHSDLYAANVLPADISLTDNLPAHIPSTNTLPLDRVNPSESSLSPSSSSQPSAQPNLGLWVSILLATTIAITLVSDRFVAVIEPETAELGLTPTFTGVILIPLLSDVATAIMMIRLALRNHMDLAVATATGDSLLIALFVAPVLVLFGWAIGQPIDLNFPPFSVIALAVTVTVANLITFNGRSNWLYGVFLIATYSILGVVFYYIN